MLRWLGVVGLTSGCYTSFGAGYGGGNVSGHMAVGIAVPIGSQAHWHAGVNASGNGGKPREPTLVPGPIVLGGAFTIASARHHGLTARADVVPPVGGNWLVAGTREIENTGRAYVGLGYSYTAWGTSVLDDPPRVKGRMTFSVGPEVYWLGDDRRAGVSVDWTGHISAWAIGEALDKD